MSGWDAAYLTVTDAGTVGSTTTGWRLPFSAATAAARMGPPPWEPGAYAMAVAVHLAIDGLATDYSEVAMVGFDLLNADLTPLIATPDRIERAEKLVARVRDAHRHVQVHAGPPTGATWPTLVVDAADGRAWVQHAQGVTDAGPASALPRRWVDLAHRLGLTAAPDGWLPAAWL